MAAATIVWFRQDLRVTDHPALVAAVRRGAVIPTFIWAQEEEGRWAPGGASRWWLHHSLASVSEQLKQLGSRLIIRRGPTQQALDELIEQTGASAVHWHRRYEPAVIERDTHVKASLIKRGVHAESFNGSLLYEPWTIATGEGKPYQVFTPFWKKCLAAEVDHQPLPAPTDLPSPADWPRSVPLDELELLPRIPWDRGFYDAWEVGAAAAEKRLETFIAGSIDQYGADRDRADLDGTSRLAPHLHFGEISPRQIWAAVRLARPGQGDSKKIARGGSATGAEVFLKEVGWREFAHHLLYHFPHTPELPLRENFRKFPWRCSAADLRRWQRGQTGYPIVDAAMRQLWATGIMHNRARMVVASFLVKDLRLSWLGGAEWFWDALVCADLANNTLGWQWTAGCGADAAPYFRVFNPMLQSVKCDPEGQYVRRWVPELAKLPTKWIHQPWEAPEEVLASAAVALGVNYPRPMVDHFEAKDAALAAFEKLKNG